MYPLERRTASNRPATEFIGHVPQIGWQLRLGEHIFVKQARWRILQLRARHRCHCRRGDLGSLRAGMEKPGCGAETRELLKLAEATGLVSQTEDNVANQGD
jgi:hypothetical protein